MPHSTNGFSVKIFYVYIMIVKINGLPFKLVMLKFLKVPRGVR